MTLLFCLRLLAATTPWILPPATTTKTVMKYGLFCIAFSSSFISLVANASSYSPKLTTTPMIHGKQFLFRPFRRV